ncbi:MAG: hypothetical protein FJX69_17005 [Alphaproteobacteria bacterium]|nr:hypothetical protein [Alphaproteobacteria bacterium]
MWEARAGWFWAAHDANAGPVPLDLDARREALLADLEIAFCAGAWSAVLLLAWSLVEPVDRAREARADAPSPDLDWLRERRNGLAHGGNGAASPVPGREEAEGAVRVVFRQLFAEAWR